MARNRELDYLTNFRFHLFDVNPKVLSLFPFVFNPAFGFKGISAPALTMDMAEIRPGNAYYGHKVVKRGVANAITLHRGARIGDTDFWRWYIAHLTGDTGSITTMKGGRRDMLLVQFAGDSFSKVSNLASASKGVSDAVSGALDNALPGNVLGAAAGLNLIAGLFIVPSRAWVLYNCMPGGYKPASDFDANSQDVSLQEMTLEYNDVDELLLA